MNVYNKYICLFFTFIKLLFSAPEFWVLNIDPTPGESSNAQRNECLNERKPPVYHGKISQPEVRNLNVMRGESHATKKGKAIRPKACDTSPCNSNCRIGCHKLIPPHRQQHIFNTYFSLDWASKNAFVADKIFAKPFTKCPGNPTTSEEEVTQRNRTMHCYYLPNEYGIKQIVCKNFFKRTLDISNGKITGLLNRMSGKEFV